MFIGNIITYIHLYYLLDPKVLFLINMIGRTIKSLGISNLFGNNTIGKSRTYVSCKSGNSSSLNELRIDLDNKHNELLKLHSYKILEPHEFTKFNNMGYFYGNNHDIKKGYICMCGNHEQLKKTIVRKYNYKPVYICKFPNSKLLNLKFEDGKDKSVYPHLYEPLKRNLMNDVFKLYTDVNNYEEYWKTLENLKKFI